MDEKLTAPAGWNPPRGAVLLWRSYRAETGEDRWVARCISCGWHAEAGTKRAADEQRRAHLCPVGTMAALPTCPVCDSTGKRCRWEGSPGRTTWHGRRIALQDRGVAARRERLNEAARAAAEANPAARVLGISVDVDEPTVIALTVAGDGRRVYGSPVAAAALPLPGTLRSQHDWVNATVRRLTWPAVGATSSGDVDAVGVAETDPHAPHPLADALQWALLDQLDHEGIPVAVVDTPKWGLATPPMSSAARAAAEAATAVTGTTPADLRWLREPQKKEKE